MNLIQFFLAIGITALAVYMYQRLRSTLLDVIFIILFFVVGIFFILFPETTNDIAHFVGVSKGANLLLYSAILFLLFLILKLYSRLRKVEQKFTELVRSKTLEEAEDLGKKG